MTITTPLNHLISNKVHGSKYLATLIHYAFVLQEQLQIMLLLANTDLDSSPRKNLNILAVDILSNQDVIFFMSVADSIVTGIREGTL